jgi:hypothetical protein
MKKSNYLLALLLSVVLISCKEKDASDCDCSELNGLESIAGRGGLSGITKNGEVFTGICAKKDQNDSIIEKSFIKNGWLIQQILRLKGNNKYYTGTDIKYENGNRKDGFKISMTDNDNIKYTTWADLYKNGVVSGWNFELYKHDDGYHIIVSFPHVDSKDIEKFRPKCMSIASIQKKTYNANNEVAVYDGFSSDYNLSEQKCLEILDGLKKELPHFDYWKI